MAIELEPFDPAEMLRTPEAVAAFLADMFEHGDVCAVAEALGVAARARGVMDLARSTGIPRATLYRTLCSHGNPTLGQTMRVLDGLGLALTVTPKADDTEHMIG